MTEFLRFPHTPHLAWLAPVPAREDKVLDARERLELLSGEVVVEEKVDGANLGLSVDSRGELCAQNRGKYLDLANLTGQWKPLGRWLSVRHDDLIDALAPGVILFGEWCYAVHSIRYSRLPDWFLAFDVFDRREGTFWSSGRRDELAALVDLSLVPRIASGRFDLAGIIALLTMSKLGDVPAEGLYVRGEANGRLVARAKLVRAEFVQAIDEHWSKRQLEPNQLAAGRFG